LRHSELLRLRFDHFKIPAIKTTYVAFSVVRVKSAMYVLMKQSWVLNCGTCMYNVLQFPSHNHSRTGFQNGYQGRVEQKRVYLKLFCNLFSDMGVSCHRQHTTCIFSCLKWRGGFIIHLLCVMSMVKLHWKCLKC